VRPMVTLLLVALLGSCDDMSSQPKAGLYDPAAQIVQPADGVVRWGDQTAVPPTLDLALLQRGQQRFRIDCTPCHGELGDGDGMVAQRGFPHPPSYHSERLRQASTQHFYGVMTNGYRAIYAFAGRVAPADRWAIAAYIRALQVSQNVAARDLTPEQAQALR